MKYNSKNKIGKFLNVFTLTLIIILASCSSNSNDEVILDKESRLIYNVDLVASKHNEGLKHIYGQLNNAPISDENSTYVFMGEKSKEFILQNGLESNYENAIPNTIIDEDIINFERKLNGQLFRTSSENNFSTEFANEYFTLKDVILDDSINMNDKIVYLSNYDPSDKIADDLEYTMLMTMSAVGESSLEYWSTEGYSWISNVNNSNNRTTSGDFNWNIVGFADASGAVTAAAGLWASGTGAAMVAAGGPGGAVGVGLVIAAGGIGSSASAFVGQAIFGGWFD